MCLHEIVDFFDHVVYDEIGLLRVTQANYIRLLTLSLRILIPIILHYLTQHQVVFYKAYWHLMPTIVAYLTELAHSIRQCDLCAHRFHSLFEQLCGLGCLILELCEFLDKHALSTSYRIVGLSIVIKLELVFCRYLAEFSCLYT